MQHKFFPDVQLENRTGDQGRFICATGPRLSLLGCAMSMPDSRASNARRDHIAFMTGRRWSDAGANSKPQHVEQPNECSSPLDRRQLRDRTRDRRGCGGRRRIGDDRLGI